MICPKCGGKNFNLEITTVVTKTYRIYKNGRPTDHPISSEMSNQDMADNDNIVRCFSCNTGYVLIEKGRAELLHRVDYSKVDLKTEAVESEF